MDCSLCSCTAKTNREVFRAPHWPLKIVPFEVCRLDKDLCFSFAVKSLLLCAEPSPRLDAQRGRPGAERDRHAPRRARSSGAAGAVGFSSDTHLGRVCLAPDRARLGKGAGRLGFVLALLGAGEARGAQGPAGAPRDGFCCCRAQKRRPRVGASAVAGAVRLGEPWPGGCRLSDPGVAAPLEDQCRGLFRPHSGSDWCSGPWAMLAKLPSCLLPQVLPKTASTAPDTWLPWGHSQFPTLGPPVQTGLAASLGKSGANR